MTGPTKSDYLCLGDAELLAQCEVDRYRGSGPGGQKRNKTESAVRLRHLPTGLQVVATESRSQHENRRRGLRRLRERIALEVRRPLVLQGYAPPPELLALLAASRSSVTRETHLRALQGLLDLFAALNGSVRDTAERLGVSTASLSRLLLADPQVTATVNRLRAELGLHPLR
ncbi:MAG: peptide chain release factor-like protein [Deltaproteobacteria bacterium]|nr:peptide chain release factor-like protein [Deltaproteobacteria bacterium]